MESQSLRTASLYINNLLLSRGLLRDGISIEFATPSKVEGGLNATMVKIMNLVHDLILRRDRETDTLSTVSQNLQSLRTSSAQQTQSITRLETRSADLDRQLALASTQERAAKAALKSAETRTRALREEMARLKGTVIQIRGQCANDIRRRDGEITKMKRHLEGRRGRDGNGGQIGVVVVRPVMSKPQQGGGMHVENDVELGSPEYSLKQESTEFLTRLSQGLSDENDALIGLVRSTLAALRSLQGLPRDSAQGIDQLDNAGIGHNKLIPAPPPSYEDLASSTDEVLEHLRGILTNPSFVPLEELEIREDEIIRLREGWERMEVRWKEAMALMDGWRKRMVNTGDTVNLEELRIGLNLGSEIPPLAFGQEASLPKEDLQGDDLGSSRLCGEVQDNMEEPSQVGFNSSQFYDEAQDDGEEPSTVDVIDDPSIDELSAAAIPTKQVLTARSPNARLPISPQRRAFPTITEENTQQLRDEAQDLPQGISPIKALDSPAKPKSHTVRQSPRSSPHSSTRTVAQKLAQAQAEAEEARLRTETRSRRKASGRGVGRSKGSRRRSTLSPEELEILLGCL